MHAAQVTASPVFGVPGQRLPPHHSPAPQKITWLAQLIQAEAGNQSYVAQVAVGAVVVNRLQAATFPHTLWSVLHQPNQFETVANGRWATAHPSASAWKAANAALSGIDPTDHALYFYNPALPHAGWMNQLSDCHLIGAMNFCTNAP